MKTLQLLFVLLLSAGLVSADVGEKVWGTGRREEIIYTNWFEGDASYTVAAYADTTCLILNREIITLILPCSRELSKRSWSRDVLITRFSLTGKTDAASGDSQTSTDGCNLQLMTGQAGFTVLAGGELKAPASDVIIEEGEVIEVTPEFLLSAGTSLAIAVKNGDFCQAGSACVCAAAWKDSQLEIWGIFQ